MSISRCNFILSLSLLIALSGCSGSRLRNTFRAEREFLTLSELEESDALQDDTRQQPKRWVEGLVSFSKDAADEEETSPKRQGLLNFGRLLGRDDESIPSDPFVVADEDSESSEESGEDSSDRTVVSVSSSRELPTELAEPLVGDDWVAEMAESAAAEDSRVTSEQSTADTSFSDIMAEFADDVDETEELDSLADQLMAEHSSKSGAIDDMVADFSANSTEVDRVELSPDTFFDDASESEENIPVLSMSDGTDNPFDTDRRPAQFEDSFPDLPDNVGETPPFDFDESVAETVTSGEVGTQMGEGTDSETSRHGMADIFGNDVLNPGSLWEDAGQADGWASDPAPRRVNRESEFGQQEQPEPAWDSASSSDSGNSFDRVDGHHRVQENMTFASNPLLLPGIEPGLQSQAGTLAQAPMNPPSTSGLNADPFLNDFETLAEATPNLPTIASGSSDGAIAGFSPKMWVVLLGSVIILYLLFAPERQNGSQPDNR